MGHAAQGPGEAPLIASIPSCPVGKASRLHLFAVVVSFLGEFDSNAACHPWPPTSAVDVSKQGIAGFRPKLRGTPLALTVLV